MSLNRILFIVVALLLFALASCETLVPRPLPKFQYNELVIVTKGFYEGCVGTVLEAKYNDAVTEDNYLYELNVKKCKGDLISPRIAVGESMIKSND